MMILRVGLVLFSVACTSALLLPTRRELARSAAVGAAASLLCELPARADDVLVPGPREITNTVNVKTGGNGNTVGVLRRRFTGAGDPSWTFPTTDITARVNAEPFEKSFPYTGKGDFVRLDEGVDTDFYKFPKLVYHIDEGAVAALTHYYARAIPDGSDVLDICSSWVSHYPRSMPERMKSIVGTGINAIELQCNDQLSSWKQADLNVKAKLPFADKSFDVLTCVVSFDYLTHPMEARASIIERAHERVPPDRSRPSPRAVSALAPCATALRACR